MTLKQESTEVEVILDSKCSGIFFTVDSNMLQNIHLQDLFKNILMLSISNLGNL